MMMYPFVLIFNFLSLFSFLIVLGYFELDREHSWTTLSEPNHWKVQMNRDEFICDPEKHQDLIDRLIELKLIERSNRPSVPLRYHDFPILRLLF